MVNEPAIYLAPEDEPDSEERQRRSAKGPPFRKTAGFKVRESRKGNY